MKNLPVICFILLLSFFGSALYAHEKCSICWAAFEKEHHKFCRLTDSAMAHAFFEELDLQLEKEIEENKILGKGLSAAILASLFIGAVLVGYLIYYRKRKLVLTKQKWPQAVQKVVHSRSEKNKKTPLKQIRFEKYKFPDGADRQFIKDIEQLMREEKLYRERALTVDALALKLGAKPHYISEAINRCMQMSFNTYINEYRISEAIELLSNKDTERLHIDEIASRVGFSNRLNFYRVFKKMTGLSPTEFKRNKSEFRIKK